MKLLGQIIHAAPSFKDLEKRIAKNRDSSVCEDRDIELSWDTLPDDVRKTLVEMGEVVYIPTDFDADNDKNESHK